MPLTERTLHRVEILENDHVQVRVVTVVERDGVEIARTNNRHVIMPGQDYANETGKVRRMAAGAHVQTVLDREVKMNEHSIAKSARDEAKMNREADDTPENEEAEAAAEAALLVAEAELEAAEAAHEVFLLSEDS